MRKFLPAILLFGTLAAAPAFGQSPAATPIIVQAAKPAAPAANPTSSASGGTADVLKALQELKAANDETLNKQRAELEKLDELQKAAEQLKVYAKRT